MTNALTNEIQAEQEFHRKKYGSDLDWFCCIRNHNSLAVFCDNTPLERRQHLIEVAALAVSAIETIDMKLAPANAGAAPVADRQVRPTTPPPEMDGTQPHSERKKL